MNIITCSHCLVDLSENNFGRNKQVCKRCNVNIKSKLWREKNKEKVSANKKTYRKKNKEKVLANVKKYKERNKEKVLEARRQRYQKTKEKSNKQSRAYYAENKERIKEWRKKYNEENKEKIRLRHSVNRAEKRKINPSYKISCVMSNAIWSALKVKNSSKKGCSWEKILGYTRDDLKSHLESNFTSEMTWENYGSYWHIDHIIPKSWFEYSNFEDENFKKCWALNNLQPLKAQDNLSKCNRWAG